MIVSGRAVAVLGREEVEQLAFGWLASRGLEKDLLEALCWALLLRSVEQEPVHWAVPKGLVAR